MRSEEEIIKEIVELLEEKVSPAVSQHGGNIAFISYSNGDLMLELQGACSGCAGSDITLKHGVEHMIKHYVPEVTNIIAEDGFSTVDPFYSDPFDFHDPMMGDVDDTPN